MKMKSKRHGIMKLFLELHIFVDDPFELGVKRLKTLDLLLGFSKSSCLEMALETLRHGIPRL